MIVHLYTSYSDLVDLREGKRIPVWTKDTRDRGDILIGVSLDEYLLEPIGESYALSKR